PIGAQTAKLRTFANCAAIGADGSSSASSPGYNTTDDSSCDGSSIPPISLALCNLRQSAYSLIDVEIASTYEWLRFADPSEIHPTFRADFVRDQNQAEQGAAANP